MPVTVAVGTTRKPKLNALRSALSTVAPGTQFEILPFDVPSGVRHTPLSRDDLMLGARTRAQALVEIAHANRHPWNFFAGLEGGLDVIHQNGGRLVFLESWAYITDGARSSYGRSGAVLIPDSLAARVLDDGVELSAAIDAFANSQNIRDAQGAWGVLTRNAITREDAFRTAVIAALTPFFNSAMYP
jgi:inosine/xanthosine triphosphatase